MAPDGVVLEKVVNSLKSVGKFEVRGISVTESSQVYKAVEPDLHKTLVVKLIPVSLWVDNRQKASSIVATERKIIKGFDHPNIPRLITAGEVDEHLFWIYEFVDGVPLSRMLERRETLSALDLLDMGRQLCAGLEYAWKSGIVHHRLNPNNLIVEWDGCAKLLDWSVPGYPDLGPNASARTVQAAQYFAPEQLAGEIGDERSGLFSVAAILYRLATATMPYAGDDINSLSESIQSSTPRSPTAINPRIPPGISAPIMKALSKDPNARPQSSQVFIHDLENYKKFGVNNELPQNFKSSRPTAPPSFAPPSYTAPPQPEILQLDQPWSQADTAQTAVVEQASPGMVATTSEQLSQPLAVEAVPTGETVYREPEPVQPKPKVKVNLPRVDWAKIARQAIESTTVTIKRISPLAASLVVAGILVAFLAWRVIVPYMLVSHASEVAAPAQTVQQEEPVASVQEQPPVPDPEPDSSVSQASTAATMGVRVGRKKKNAAPAPLPQVPVVGELSVYSEPSGAQFQIDGHSDGSFVTPATVGQLSPGRHSVTFAKTGFRSETLPVEVAAASRATMMMKLSPQGGTLTLTTSPAGASVVIDGKDTGKITPAQLLVARGQHKVTFKLVGYLEANLAVNVADGGNHPVSSNLIVMGRTIDIKVKKGLFSRAGGKDMGKVNIRTNPNGAIVIVNGQLAPKATPLEFALNPGGYELSIELRGYKPLKKVIVVESDTKINLDEVLEPVR